MKTSGDRICKTCRYWSELIVRYGGPNRSLEALCLNREGPFYSLFCRGAQRCQTWASGHLGAIDDPDLPEGAYANQGVAEPRNDADAAFDHFSNSTKPSTTRLSAASKKIAGILRISCRALETFTDHKSHRKYVRDRPSSNDPLEGLPVEQDRTRHGLQARRGRTENPAPC
jgi:hypothetical protein